MSEPALRVVPPVNLDEFERRLRATGSLGGVESDPLAELARLLGGERAAHEAPHQDVGAHGEPEAGDFSNEDRHGGGANVEYDGPAEEARIDSAPEHEAGNYGGYDGASEENALDEAPAPRRSRAKVGALAILILIGAVGAAGGWIYRGGVPGLHNRLPPFIMAATGPTKVRPPTQATVASNNNIASLLMKDDQAKPTPIKIVSHEEQPIDLQEQGKLLASAAAPSAPPASEPTIAPAPLVVVNTPAPSAAGSAPAQGAAAPTPAASAPVAAAQSAKPAAASDWDASGATVGSIGKPAASSDWDASAATVGSTAAQPDEPSPFPEPRRVKTVSVRADGTVIPAGADNELSAPTPAAPAPTTDATTAPADATPPSAPDAAAAEAATPKLDLAPKHGAKSTARVPIARIETTGPSATNRSPEAPLQISPLVQRDTAARSHTPSRRVAEQTSTPDTAVVRTRDALEQPAPIRIASIAPVAAASAASAAGDYSVQLAAPGSDAEAQSLSRRLEAKYASELGGRSPVIRKADSKGHTVYRVRLVGLTHADAIALCESLKAHGGACFLAHE